MPARRLAPPRQAFFTLPHRTDVVTGTVLPAKHTPPKQMQVTRKSLNLLIFYIVVLEMCAKRRPSNAHYTPLPKFQGSERQIIVSLHGQSLNSKHVAAGTTMMVAILNFLVGLPRNNFSPKCISKYVIKILGSSTIRYLSLNWTSAKDKRLIHNAITAKSEARLREILKHFRKYACVRNQPRIYLAHGGFYFLKWHLNYYLNTHINPLPDA